MPTVTESPVAARTPEDQLLPVARVALALLPSTASEELRERRATAALRALQAAIDTWEDDLEESLALHAFRIVSQRLERFA
jgi:hypothetical protein